MGGEKEDLLSGAGNKTQIDPQDPSFVFDDFFLPRTLPFKRKTKFKDQKRYWKRLKQIAMSENDDSSGIPKYSTIEAGPSSYPSKKYCDLTGSLAKYIDPKTKLQYARKELFPVIRNLPTDVVQACLEIRNAHVVLK